MYFHFSLLFVTFPIMSSGALIGNQCTDCTRSDASRSKRSSDNKAIDHTSAFIMISRQLQLDCVYGKDKGKKFIDPKYTWTDRRKKVLKDGRFQITEGRLKLIDAQAKDQGLYTCTVKHGENIDRYKHIIKVFVIPDFSYSVHLQYAGRACGRSQRVQKLAMVKDSICKGTKCRVKNINGVCHVITGKTKKHELWVSFSVRPDPDLKLPICDTACTEKFIMINLNSNLASVKSFAASEKKSTKAGIFTLKSDGMKVKLIKKCPGGFIKDGVICRPCRPGTVSKNNDKACDPCPEGSFQPGFAMKTCIPCEKGSITKQTGSRSRKACRKTQMLAVSEEGQSAVMTAVGVTSCLAIIFLIIGGVALAAYLNYQKDQKEQREYREMEKARKKERGEVDDDDDDDDEDDDDQLLLPKKTPDGKGWVVSKPKTPGKPFDLMQIFQGQTGAKKAVSEDIYMEATDVRPPGMFQGNPTQNIDDAIYDVPDPSHVTSQEYHDAHLYWDLRRNDPSLTMTLEPHPPAQVLPGVVDVQKRLGPLPDPPITNQGTTQSSRL